MTRRLRILHVVHKLDYGGLERLVGALVERLPRDRFENHILTLSDFGRFAEDLAGHAQLHQERSLRRWSMIWPRGLTRTIRALAPDVVHVVVAVSEALRRQMAATLVPRPAEIRVVINGIDTGRFQPRSVNGSVRGELGLPAGAPVIGSIGRLDAIKAYDVMLQAFARLRAGWSDAHGAPPSLVLVGDGPERARLAALIDQLELRDAARLAGWRKDVENVYPAFDIFTLSSWSEGTSLGLLEAMSSGVCPVVTDVGGSGAALGEALRHRLVPPGNPTALAAAWRDALGDSARRTRDAAAGRRRVEQAFGVDAMVREYERIYSGGE